MKIIIDIDKTAYNHIIDGTEDSRDESEALYSIKNAKLFNDYVTARLENIKTEIERRKRLFERAKDTNEYALGKYDAYDYVSFNILEKLIKELNGEQDNA